MTAQIQGKHVSLSITGACRTQTELRKCNMGVWQTQGTSTWSSVISLTCYSTLRRAVVQGLTHKMHFSNKLCWCSSLLFSPSDVFFFWQIHTLKGGIRYRRHQVMTPTPNYPRWLVSCLSVTSQVLPDQTLLYRQHPVEGCHSNSSSPHLCNLILFIEFFFSSEQLHGNSSWCLVGKGTPSDMNRNWSQYEYATP